MTAKSYRSLVGLLVVGIVLLVGCIWNLLWRYSLERMDEKTAWSLVVGYDRMRMSTDKMGVEDAIACLDVIAQAQPHLKNPHLSLIVERERAKTIRYVIEGLRKKTGEDLGEDPAAWINTYQPK